jgi:hypothetical protein
MNPTTLFKKFLLGGKPEFKPKLSAKEEADKKFHAALVAASRRPVSAVDRYRAALRG